MAHRQQQGQGTDREQSLGRGMRQGTDGFGQHAQIEVYREAESK